MLLPPKMRPVSDGNQCPRWWGGYSRAAGRKSSLSSFENGVRGARFPQLPLGSDTGPCPARRSEEHTSELQSLMRISYAVFCLKKKITYLNHFFVFLSYFLSTVSYQYCYFIIFF